ncbi:hypothetical protein [Algoriphagus taiwanensis]|uniref:Outer membrane protein beta-barrel domain-containing protein n=1 Tax=Algoriphagus taiwanensis TaxID=1445656 RepID=A0ABQ6Q020_9BACT|nr:hypothetical protein Ataiwa_18160 [Algoriphagus taiwanensis]
MDKRDNFEEKIKAKLEEVSGKEADQAWQSFAPLLHTPSIPFWKHWTMPYLFASVLFLGSLAWHQWGEKRQDTPIAAQLEPSRIIDTLYLRDTVYVVDTVWVYKKVYVEERETLQSRLRLDFPKENTSSIPSQSFLSATESGGNEPALTGDGQKSLSSEIKEINLQQEQQKPQNQKTVSESQESETQVANTGKQNENNPGGTLSESSAPVRRSMAAPSLATEPKVVFKSEKVLVVGDTSNLSNPPIKSKSKPMMHLELGGSLLFPISNLAEYYKPLQPGIHIGLEWESGWGVYLGAIRNQMEGELDDEEIMSLDSDLVGALPNVPSDISTLDEVYFVNRQWFFPLELRWRSLYYSGFSFESSFGLIGNYLSRQDFTYEFENNAELEYQFGKTNSSEFSLSHLRVGIGTNYLLSRRMGLFLRSHYWLPVSRPGLIQDRVHGMEVGVGVNFFLGK